MYMMSIKWHLKLIPRSFFSLAEKRKSRSWKHTGTRTRIVSQQTLEKDGQTGGREEVRRTLKTSNITCNQVLELSTSNFSQLTQYPQGVMAISARTCEFFPQGLRVVSSFQKSPVVKGLKLHCTSRNTNPRGTKLVWVIKSIQKWRFPNIGIALNYLVTDFCTGGSTNTS